MTFQPEKSKDAIVIYVATRGSGSQELTVDLITQDFVQTEALKFFERQTSELSTPPAHDRSHQ